MQKIRDIVSKTSAELKKKQMKNRDYSGLNVVSLKELCSKEYPEKSWLVDKLIPAGCITFISGDPASYKSWLSFYIMACIAKGEKVFNAFETQKTNVLLIDEENIPRIIKDRMQMITDNIELPIDIVSLEEIKLHHDADRLLQYCLDKEIGLLVIDSFVRVHKADENDARKMSEVTSYLKRFVKQGITVLCIHHNRKGGGGNSYGSQEMRGSSDILASIDCQLAVRADRTRKVITIEQKKIRGDKEISPFEVVVVEGDDVISFEYNGDIQMVQTATERAEDQIFSLLENQKEPLNQKKIIEMTKLGEKSVQKALEILENAKKVKWNRGFGKTKLYCAVRVEKEKVIDK